MKLELPLHERKLIKETAQELYPDNRLQQEAWVQDATKRRLSSEPLQYLMGNQTFLNHRYQVGPGVLIPRPETEILVDAILKNLNLEPLKGLEIGTGSGAVSIEVLSNRPEYSITATETSNIAIQYAKLNAKAVLGDQVKQIHFLSVPDPEVVFPFLELNDSLRFDFLISNPPYLSPSDPIETDVLRHEPELALFPVNPDPNYFYRRIALESKDILKPNGMIFLEIPHQRAEAIQRYFMNPNFINVEVLNDLTNRPRVLIAKRSGI